MTAKEGIESIKKIEEEINKKMHNIMAFDIPFMKEHNFKLEEEALRYKYQGLEEARNIVWDIMSKYEIH